MTRLFAPILFISLAFFSSSGQANTEHANHNMILLGTTEIFATHIVYLEPHNFQVILKIVFPKTATLAYRNEKNLHPNEQFRFVLKHLDMAHIQDANAISGSLIRVDTSGKKTIIMESVVLEKSQYRILFFDELPLSLAGDGA